MQPIPSGNVPKPPQGGSSATRIVKNCEDNHDFKDNTGLFLVRLPDGVMQDTGLQVSVCKRCGILSIRNQVMG